MQVHAHGDKRYTVRLECGEDAMKRLAEFAAERGIGAAALRGIGASLGAELASYDLEKKRYDTYPVEGPTEVISLLGNLSIGLDGMPMVHAHATLSRPDGTALGGHVMQLTVGATLEVDVEVLPGSLHRVMDADIGLALLKRRED